jgi:hypothetical protein
VFTVTCCGLKVAGAFISPAHICHDSCVMEKGCVNLYTISINPWTGTHWVTHKVGLAYIMCCCMHSMCKNGRQGIVICFSISVSAIHTMLWFFFVSCIMDWWGSIQKQPSHCPICTFSNSSLATPAFRTLRLDKLWSDMLGCKCYCMCPCRNVKY